MRQGEIKPVLANTRTFSLSLARFFTSVKVIGKTREIRLDPLILMSFSFFIVS